MKVLGNKSKETELKNDYFSGVVLNSVRCMGDFLLAFYLVICIFLLIRCQKYGLGHGR